MKIVDVCAFYSPKGGGVRTYIDRKLAAAPQFGHDVTVIAPGPEDRIEARGPNARIRWLASPVFPLDRNYHYFDDEAAIHAALDAEQPDMIEASSPWRSAAQVAAWPGRAPRALVMHSDPMAAYFYRWFDPIASRATIDRHFEWFWRHLRRLDSGFDFIVSASNSLSDRLQAGGLQKVETIPMGVDPGIFSPTLRDEKLRTTLLAECALGPDAMLLLGVGRLAPEKRWRMVIEAAMAAGTRAPVGLVLIGGGRERAKLVRQIAFNPHIRLLQPITDRHALAKVMASADALIHGCEAETFCMAAAEARASGLPLIVPDAGGASDQAVGPMDLRYRARMARQAAAAILRADKMRRRPRPPVPEPRVMDDHFAELFAAYASLVGRQQRRAA